MGAASAPLHPTLRRGQPDRRFSTGSLPPVAFPAEVLCGFGWRLHARPERSLERPRSVCGLMANALGPALQLRGGLCPTVPSGRPTQVAFSSHALRGVSSVPPATCTRSPRAGSPPSLPRARPCPLSGSTTATEPAWGPEDTQRGQDGVLSGPSHSAALSQKDKLVWVLRRRRLRAVLFVWPWAVGELGTLIPTCGPRSFIPGSPVAPTVSPPWLCSLKEGVPNPAGPVPDDSGHRMDTSKEGLAPRGRAFSFLPAG